MQTVSEKKRAALLTFKNFFLVMVWIELRGCAWTEPLCEHFDARDFRLTYCTLRNLHFVSLKEINYFSKRWLHVSLWHWLSPVRWSLQLVLIRFLQWSVITLTPSCTISGQRAVCGYIVDSSYDPAEVGGAFINRILYDWSISWF